MSPPKLSLRDLDIVIPFRQSSEERRENLHAVLAHLALTYSDYRVWLMEADVTPKFDWALAADMNVRHIFVPHGGRFPKAALCNMGARLSRSPVICFHDADSLANPSLMSYCVGAMLDHDKSDALCAYGTVINVSGKLKQSFIEDPSYAIFSELKMEDLPVDAQILYMSANGGIVFFHRGAYVRVGGYNEQLEGWGGEDDELFSRATRLGLAWHSFPGWPLIHLHHGSASRNEAIAEIQGSENVLAANAAATMPIDELDAMALRLSASFVAPTFPRGTP